MKTRTVSFAAPCSAVSWACLGGKWESRGPLSSYFDETDTDSFFGQNTWEQAESEAQRRVLHRALEKGNLEVEQVDTVFAGDLMNQCIGSTFAMRHFPLPFCGIYGACSTMGEGLILSGLTIAGGGVKQTAVMTSSHFCTAERQYRMPLPYGSQRTPTAQWTATAAGCCILSAEGDGPYLKKAVIGRVVDLGITDTANMGAAMAPAAIDTLETLFSDTHTVPADYDLIVTGDLGAVGHRIVTELMGRDGYNMTKNYTDCGLLLYDRQKQDMHAGGSGAGCSAAVLCGYLLTEMKRGRWQKIIFAPTGALLSPTSSMQKQSIPGICHAVVWERER